MDVKDFVKIWDGSPVNVMELKVLPSELIRGKPLSVNRYYHIWCPRCECSYSVFVEWNVQFPFTCVLCGYIFCESELI